MEALQYFFSYSRKDAAFVLKLAQELREVGINLWLDKLDILGGQRWDRAVEDALQTCQAMIAVLSPDALASHNVMDDERSETCRRRRRGAESVRHGWLCEQAPGTLVVMWAYPDGCSSEWST